MSLHKKFPVTISDKFEGMPFAVVTVAILLSMTAFRVVMASYSGTADNAGGRTEGGRRSRDRYTELHQP